MKCNDNQPTRNKRRVRLNIAYVFLAVWIVGLVLFSLYEMPDIFGSWMECSSVAAAVLIVSLLVPSYKKMFLEEKMVLFFLFSPILLIVLIVLFFFVLTKFYESFWMP